MDTVFSPAEALFLLCGEKTSPHTLLKVTTLDLVWRGLLRIALEPHAAGLFRPRVFPGDALRGFKPQPFEAPFVARLKQEAGYSPDLQRYIHELEKKQYSSSIKSLGVIQHHASLKGLLETGFFSTLFGGYRANKAGQKVADELAERLQTGATLLLANRPGEAVQLLGRLVLLLDQPVCLPGKGRPLPDAPEALRAAAASLGAPLVLPSAPLTDALNWPPDLFAIFDLAMQSSLRGGRKIAGNGSQTAESAYISSGYADYEYDDEDDDGDDGDSDGGDGDGGGDGGD